MTFTKLNTELSFLKNISFDHKYFELEDSNDIRVFYANEELDYNNKGIKDTIKPNTMTIFAPGSSYASEKLELPGLMIQDVQFDCITPKTTQGTMMCDAILEFGVKSKLMNGDVQMHLNDALPISLNNLNELTVFVDPTGHLEFVFD